MSWLRRIKVKRCTKKEMKRLIREKFPNKRYRVRFVQYRSYKQNEAGYYISASIYSGLFYWGEAMYIPGNETEYTFEEKR